MARILERIVMVVCSALVLAVSAREPASRPNVVVILADDMGFSDVGCYGGDVRTPHIDGLAAKGVRFTQFYNTARCWPSRAALLSGFYAQQIRRDGGLPGVRKGRRPAWARLLPDLLKPLGYRSYMSGKWHVDGQPLGNGFEHAYVTNDHNRFFSPKNHAEDGDRLPALGRDSGYYSTDAITDYAIKYLSTHREQHADQPFFLYVAYICPHFPLHALQDDIDRYRERYLIGWDVIRAERMARLKDLGILDCGLSELESEVVPSWNLKAAALQEQIGPGEAAYAVPWASLTDEQKRFQATKMAIHAAMIDRMDQNVGRLLETLETMGVLDNTVVMVASDNGASAEQIIRGDRHDKSAPLGSAGSYLCLGPGWSTAANTPFRFHKHWVHEGGISTPFVVHWPAGIGSGGVLDHTPGHFVDIAPTILELAGGQWPTTLDDGTAVPATPGRSLVPALKRTAAVQRDYIFWMHQGNQAIRMGDWKLVLRKGGDWELYNLARDRSETRNVAAQNPGVVSRLKTRYAACIETFTEQAKTK